MAAKGKKKAVKKRPSREPKHKFSKLRGFHGSMDLPASMSALLVLGDVEESTKALSTQMKFEDWQKDVQKSDLPPDDIGDTHVCPFRYEGHEWTTIIHKYFSSSLARELSKTMKTRVLLIGWEDCSGSLDYMACERGRVVEVFHSHDFESFCELSPNEVSKALDSRMPSAFVAGSTERKIKTIILKKLSKEPGVELWERVNNVFDDFLKSQNAFVGFNIMDEPGREYFPLAEADDDGIARIDLVELSD